MRVPLLHIIHHPGKNPPLLHSISPVSCLSLLHLSTDHHALPPSHPKRSLRPPPHNRIPYHQSRFPFRYSRNISCCDDYAMNMTCGIINVYSLFENFSTNCALQCFHLLFFTPSATNLWHNLSYPTALFCCMLRTTTKIKGPG